MYGIEIRYVDRHRKKPKEDVEKRIGNQKQIEHTKETGKIFLTKKVFS